MASEPRRQEPRTANVEPPAAVVRLANEEREWLAAKARTERAKRAVGEREKKAGRKPILEDKVSSKIPDEREKPRAREQVARQHSVSERKVRDAQTVHKHSPKLAQEVKEGKKTLAQARREAERETRRKELEKKAKEAEQKRLLTTEATENTWQIHHGDCVEELAKIERSTVRLIFADPPYNIGIDYGPGAAADDLPKEQYLNWCREWIRLCAERLAPDGSLWLMINDEWADYYGVMLREVGLHRRNWIKWYETFGVNCQDKFNRCSRHIFYCVADPKNFVFNRDAVCKPSARQEIYGDSRADPGGKVWDDVWEIPRLVGTAKERIPDFPTQIPLAITRAIVGCASEPGDLVVDPFNGSGSTGVAAIELGRRYIGIEKEEKFWRLANDRLKGIVVSVSQ